MANAVSKLTAKTITIKPMAIKTLNLVLIGETPLICHAWSEKAKLMMLNKHMKKANPGKEAKNPQKDYEDSLYSMGKNKYGFPVVGIKAAAVDACSFLPDITKVEARGTFHINGDLLEIIGAPSMREDMVRIGMGTADIRYRAEFKQWHIHVPLRYNSSVLSDEQLMMLFNTAGFAVGIGEWRPQRDGQFGLFHVATEDELRQLTKRRAG